MVGTGFVMFTILMRIGQIIELIIWLFFVLIATGIYTQGDYGGVRMPISKANMRERKRLERAIVNP